MIFSPGITHGTVGSGKENEENFVLLWSHTDQS